MCLFSRQRNVGRLRYSPGLCTSLTEPETEPLFNCSCSVVGFISQVRPLAKNHITQLINRVLSHDAKSFSGTVHFKCDTVKSLETTPCCFDLKLKSTVINGTRTFQSKKVIQPSAQLSYSLRFTPPVVLEKRSLTYQCSPTATHTSETFRRCSKNQRKGKNLESAT